MNIKFRVEGRPPKKDGSQSLWSEKSHQAKLVFNLREKAFEAKQDAKIKESYSGLVQIKISILVSMTIKTIRLKSLPDIKIMNMR